MEEEKKMRRQRGIPCTTGLRESSKVLREAKHHDDQPDLGLRESTGHSLLQLFGELHHLGSQRHAGLHHHQVPGAQGVSVALGALGGLFPCMVLHGDIGSIFNQGLSENAETGDCIRTSL